MDGLGLVSTWRTELIDVAENRVQISYTDELILQTAPTRTVIGAGCRLEHGIIAANDADGWTKRLMRIGVANHGWAYVEPGIGGISRTGERDAGQDMRRAQWLMETQDATYFPIKSWERLPEALHLTQYDVGHEIVFTHAEVMGRTGSVLASQNPRTDTTPGVEVGELIVRVQMKDGSPIEVKQSAVAALVKDGDYENAVSVGLRYPPGAKVWVKSHVRAGQPYQWRAAMATGWDRGELQVTALDTGEQWQVRRHLLAPGDEPAPQVLEIAARKDGRNAAPRGKRAKKWNVPKANG